MKIGFIGLGIMGSRMANNLAEGGYNLLIHNRTKQKAETLLKKDNVTWKDTPADVAREADILITMLSSPTAVEQTAQGGHGFLNYLPKGTTWVDSSTVNPSFSKKMAELSQNNGLHFIDAPVAGSKAPAEKGELIFLVGGQEKQISSIAPLFNIMGKTYIHAGANGQGTALKMVFNLLLGQAMHAFSEGMALGESLGLDQQMLFDILLDSPVVAPFIKGKKEKMEHNSYEPEFPLKWMQKDLHLAAFEQETALPAVNTIKEIYALAKKAGYADKDFSAMYEFLHKNQNK